MAKAKKKGKSEKKQGDGGELTPAQEIALLKKENDLLKLNLSWQNSQSHGFLLEKDDLFEEVRNLRKSFGDQNRETIEVKADMSRHYKAMQRALLEKIGALESINESLKEASKMEKSNLEAAKLVLEQNIVEKNKQIEKQKQTMENMAVEFGNMLKFTLEKLNEKIDLNSSQDEWTKALERSQERFKQKLRNKTDEEINNQLS